MAWGFASGLQALQSEAGIDAAGVTAHARSLEHHHHRARPRAPRPCRAEARGGGDRLYVTGTIGDAYLDGALTEPALARDWGFPDEDLAHVIERYRRRPPP